MWTLYVLLLFAYQILLLLAVGYGPAAATFRRSSAWPLRWTWASLFGCAVLTVVHADLMFDWLTGAQAARVALALCLANSAALGVWAHRRSPSETVSTAEVSKPSRSLRRSPMVPAALAGLIYLAPLILTNQRGFFTINGGDFGSYGGWAEYFQDKTVRGAPPDPRINPSKSGFANLLVEVSRPAGKWRIGNITYFTAMKALTPGDWYTNYMVTVGVFLFTLTLGVSLVAKEVLGLPLRGAVFCGYGFLACNTLFWLASAHYSPNVAGLALVHGLGALAFHILRSARWSALPAAGLLAAATFLHYPEAFPYSLVFFGFAAFAVIRRRPTAWRAAAVLCTGVPLLAYAVTPSIFPYLMRHLLAIAGYERPGDFVGIYYWSYPLQALGVVDYDKSLNSKPEPWTRLDLLALGSAGALACVFLVRGIAQSRRRSPRFAFAAALVVFLYPIARFARGFNLLPLWKTMLYISPYVFLLVLVGALLTARRLSPGTAGHPTARRIYGWARVPAVVLFFASCLWLRADMVKRIVRGDVHAATRGNDYLALREQIAETYAHGYDGILVAYEGTGTHQATWEWLLQDFPYAFATHGIGVNEFDIGALRRRRLLVVDDGAPKFHMIDGDAAHTPPIAQFGIAAFYDPQTTTFMTPLSSSWAYIPRNCLVLRGLPGHLGIWSTVRRDAHLQMDIQPPRHPTVLGVELDGGQGSQSRLHDGEPTHLALALHLQEGFNAVRLRSELAPEIPPSAGALGVSGLVPVDPFVSPTSDQWNRRWNLATPPDERGFPSHLCFTRVNLSLD
jgi:hypothetical protein